MKYRVRYTRGAHEDLLQLYRFLMKHDLEAACAARIAIEKSLELLQVFPFTCRKVDANNPFLREMLIPFGSKGYVALFEIENDELVTVLAVRHQREEDYH